MLGGLRARVEDEPILVVPAFQDVEHAQRELAERGAVFGVSVLRFDWLFREIGRRTGHAERVASDVQRELVVEEAVRRARLELLAESAAQPGFVRAAAGFVAELERSMVEPARFTQALRAWAGEGPRRAYADEIAAIYRGYRDGLEAAGLADAELFAWHALDALRRDPASWGATPVFVYGFDDFDRAPARRARHARQPLRRRRGRFAAVRARARGLQERRHPAPAAARAGRGRDRAGSARRPLRARGARRPAPRRAQPVRGRGRHGRRRLRDRVPFRGRPACGDRARRRAPARPAARRRRAGRHRRGAAPPRRVLVAARAGLRRLRHPVLDRPLGAARAHRARPGTAGARPLRGRPGGVGRRPARLAAHAGPAAPAGARRPARGAGAPGRNARRRGGARDLGARALEARGARPPAPGGRGRRLPGRAGAPARAAVRRPLPPPGRHPERARARRPARLRGSPRRARPAQGRRRGRPAHPAGARPGAVGAARAARAPRRAAPAGPRAGRQARGDPRAALPRRLRLRPGGGRVPHRRGARAVPARRGPPRRSRAPAGCACRCARIGSTASATCSTSAARAPSGCWCCRRAPATRRATRSRSPSSSRTCATCSLRGPPSPPARCRT